MQKHEVTPAEFLPAAEPVPLLQTIVEAHKHLPPPIDGLVIGILAGLSPEGTPEVSISLPGLPERLTARSLCPVGPERIGTQCALLFEQGNPERPVVMGFLQHAVVPVSADESLQISQDKHTFHLHAEQEIVLHCGEASLSLRSDGRVELRGTTVITHATGLNRVRGASVKLN